MAWKNIPKTWQVMIAASAVIIGGTLLSSFSLYAFGIEGATSPKAMICVSAAVLSIFIKMSLQVRNEELSLCKQGYDLCIITMGTALTSGASDWIPSCAKARDDNRIGLLILTFMISLIALNLVGRVVDDFRASLAANPKTIEGIDCFVAFVAGSVIFLLNICILVTKA